MSASLSVVADLQRRLDAAIAKGDATLMIVPVASLIGYLTDALDEAERDKTLLLDIIRELRARVEQLEDER